MVVDLDKKLYYNSLQGSLQAAVPDVYVITVLPVLLLALTILNVPDQYSMWQFF